MFMQCAAMIGFGSGLVSRIGPNKRVIKTDPVHQYFRVFLNFVREREHDEMRVEYA